MRTKLAGLALSALSALLTLSPTDASAQVFRSYLSSTGLDTNPCTLPAPCRLLPAALSAVSSGGEIWLLDAANFNTGTVAINKSVTILALPGAVGSFVANNGNALQIAGAGIRVVLRNLVFVNLAGASNAGVQMTQGTSLTIDNSSFSGLLVGINIDSVGTRVQVLNSQILNNNTGVRVANGQVQLDNNNILFNNTGIRAIGNGGVSETSGGSPNNPPNGTTRVRVSGGNIMDNGTTYFMEGPGNRQSGACNGSNIFVRGNPHGPHEVSNAMRINVTAPADFNGGCSFPSQFGIEAYASPQP